MLLLLLLLLISEEMAPGVPDSWSVSTCEGASSAPLVLVLVSRARRGPPSSLQAAAPAAPAAPADKKAGPAPTAAKSAGGVPLSPLSRRRRAVPLSPAKATL